MTYNDLINGGSVGTLNRNTTGGILSEYGIVNKNNNNVIGKYFDNGAMKALNKNPLDPSNMNSPYNVPNMFSADMRETKNAQNNTKQAIENHSFNDNFNKAVGKVSPNSIMTSQAVNLATKNRKGTVNEVLPEILSNVSSDASSSIKNLTNMFTDMYNNGDQMNIDTYNRIANVFAKKAEIDMNVENEMINNWIKAKNLEYSRKGIENAIDAAETQEKYQKVANAGGIISMVASFFA